MREVLSVCWLRHALTMASGAAFYPNWARFRQERILPVAERLVSNPEVRQAIFRDHNDDDLAAALVRVGEIAHGEAVRYNGFWGWDRTPVGEFIAAHDPRATTLTS